MRRALEILKKHNRIRNDYEAYLYHVAMWGLGKRHKPDPKEYGLKL